MSNCIETNTSLGCFTPHDGSPSVSVFAAITWDSTSEAKRLVYFDADRNPIDPATYLGGGTFSAGPCQDNVPACVTWYSLVTGLDNTGTNFTHNYTIQLEFNDGTTATFNQAPTVSWTQQLTLWANEIQSLLGSPYLAEVRYRNPSNPYAGGSGLPGVPDGIDLPKMAYRYTHITGCPRDKAIIKATIIDSPDSPNLVGYTLALDYAETKKQYGWLCVECGHNGTLFYQDWSEVAVADLPVCYFMCNETLPATPISICESFPPEEACDNLNDPNQNNWVNIFVVYSQCDGEPISTAYYTQDSDGGFIPYIPVGEIVDCDTGEIVTEPVPVCQDWELQKYYFIDSDVDVGTWRERQWLNLGPAIYPTNVQSLDLVYNFLDTLGIENGLPTPTSIPDLDVTGINNANLNDGNNTANITDLQIKETYIVVEKDFLARYSGTAEGFTGVWLGKCCGDVERIHGFARSGNSGDGEITFEIPKGIHFIRIENLDAGGTNSSFSLEISFDNGQTWLDESNAPWETYSNKPTETCNLARICPETGVAQTYDTFEVLDNSKIYFCSKDCISISSSNSKCSNLEVIEHEITTGIGISVPAGFKSVTIRAIGNNVVVAGFPLRRNDFITYDATTGDCKTGVLPAIFISGNNWAWTALNIIEV